MRALYRGFALQCTVESLGRGSYFATYALAKQALAARRERPLGAPELMAAGALSGVAGWLTIYPLDVLKTRVMCLPPGEPRPAMVTLARQIWAREGPRAFFRGLGVTLLRAAPVSMVALPTFDATHAALRRLPACANG